VGSALERLLPRYDFHERHGVRVDAPPERVWAAVWEVTLAELPLARLLFAVRSLPGLLSRRGRGLPSTRERPLFDQFLDSGFTLLAEDEARELVVGLIDRPWRPSGGPSIPIESARDFVAFTQGGFVKAAMDVRMTLDGTGTRLETETRVLATDEGSRRRFARYWRVVRPGSAVIRRGLLRAIKRRAQRPRAPARPPLPMGRTRDR